MQTFDWIIVGAGITGATLAYELVQQGFSVLLVEQYDTLQGSSRFGYGGIAYWAGTTALTRQLCAEGIAIHRSLSAELEADTQFRELDLVLTISPDTDPVAIAQSYAHFAIPPQWVDAKTACELEPLLDPGAIAGALTVHHGHINLGDTVAAYRQAFIRRGGTVLQRRVTSFLRVGEKVVGIVCGDETVSANRVVVAAGALSRSLLKQSDITVPLYYTHAELIETPPLELQLRSLVMPAETRRFELEAESSRAEIDALWDEPGHELFPAILDAGAIQFLDRHLRIGQVSRTLTDPNAPLDPAASEDLLRTQVGRILPSLRDVPGTWHHCLVAFSRDRLPLVGAIPGLEGIHLFSGFSNPLAIVPSLARRFAQVAIGQSDDLIAQLSPSRFDA